MINPIELYKVNEEVSDYFKERNYINHNALLTSCCLYVGNLSYFSTEQQVYELFMRCGSVNRVIMGLNKQTKKQCGFCFVEYVTREAAEIAFETLDNTILDGRCIRVDWDVGFEEGRQYGRGVTGCQRRDEMRRKEDPARPSGNGLLGNKRERMFM
jgi:nuclear cap-binding protein subunit 2